VIGADLVSDHDNERLTESDALSESTREADCDKVSVFDRDGVDDLVSDTEKVFETDTLVVGDAVMDKLFVVEAVGVTVGAGVIVTVSVGVCVGGGTMVTEVMVSLRDHDGVPIDRVGLNV
jgi:hypothetical protein